MIDTSVVSSWGHVGGGIHSVTACPLHEAIIDRHCGEYAITLCAFGEKGKEFINKI
jgi:hypothetical protein